MKTSLVVLGSFAFFGLTAFGPIRITEPGPLPANPPAQSPAAGSGSVGAGVGLGAGTASGLHTADMQWLYDTLMKNHPEIPKAAMKRAFSYYETNASVVLNREYVTIVDFDRPSTAKRMHVIEVSTAHVESLYSAHGKNSGENYATDFSNEEGSLKSSVGIYLTGGDYQGDHGTSMYLYGMESTNSNAYSRSIVMHGADYVSAQFIKDNGRLGRSWGCPAIEMGVIDRMVHQLQDRSVFFIYSSHG